MHLNFKKKFTIYVIIVLVTTLIPISMNKRAQVFASNNSFPSLFSAIYDENELKNTIEDIYNKRSSVFVTGDLMSLKDYFDTSQKHGTWALEHEVKRVKYLNDWSKQRGMKFTNVESNIRIKKVHPGVKTTKISLEESYKFDYIYPEDENPITNSFGVGIRHTLSLVKKDNKWLIHNDWYTDCFEDALASYTGEIKGNLDMAFSPKDFVKRPCKPNSTNVNSFENYKRPTYNREKAVAYADKYCGAAWGSSNNFKYNKKYKDFNGVGGDCTNFVSQVLGDKEAGGIPTDGAWRCEYSKYGNSQGTSAWVNADGLKNYLVYSGKGRVVKKGTFKELTAATPENPGGAVDKLMLADLVCYEKKGNIDHFAVVTGRDSHGYLLINSHTTDRYHVPWDLGWGDKNIKFFLLHVN